MKGNTFAHSMYLLTAGSEKILVKCQIKYITNVHMETNISTVQRIFKMLVSSLQLFCQINKNRLEDERKHKTVTNLCLSFHKNLNPLS